MKYFVYKASRRPFPYSGPQCDKFGIEKGRLYDDPEEADSDAEVMSSIGAVGFSALPLDHMPVRSYTYDVVGLNLSPAVAAEIDRAVREVIATCGAKLIAKGFSDATDTRLILPHELKVLEGWLSPEAPSVAPSEDPSKVPTT